MTDETSWYDAGCARDCTEQHTYTWGRCALAPESARPEPTISIGTIVMEADGHPGIAMTSIPMSAWQGLITVAKWVSRGRSFAYDADPDIAQTYPDATARFALGALHDAGLIDPPAALRQVARGYCPACGRGDAAPTIEDWEQQKTHGDRAAAAIARVRQAAASRSFMAGPNAVMVVRVSDVLAALNQQETP